MDLDNSLINDVVNLNKRTALAKPTRTEPSVRVSEFNLVKSGIRKEIVPSELTDALKKHVRHALTREKIQNLKKRIKPLPKLLEKPKADRIRRSVAFDKVKEQLDRYNAVVSSNRASNHLTFPLANDIEIETGKDFTGYRMQSDLQKRLNRIDPKPEVQNLNFKKKPSYSLTMQEMLEQRKELAKMKIIESYKAAKARHQNKIKSKKYHRIQRREKVKNQIKSFEQLRNIDPERALKKLEEIERGRVEERASLRHRNTGKWARSKQVKAKYDSTNRQELAQQLSLSQELTQKVKMDEDSESENDSVVVNVAKISNANNPWVNSIQTTKEVEDFVNGYRKFWDSNTKINTCGTNTVEKKDVKHCADNTVTLETSIPFAAKVVRCVATSSWKVSVLSDTEEEDTDKNLNSNIKAKNKTNRLKDKSNVKVTTKSIKETRKYSENPKKVKKQTDFEKLRIRKDASRPQTDEPLYETSSADKNEKYLSRVLTTRVETKSAKINSKINNIDPNDILSTAAVRLQSELPDLAIEDDEEENGQLGMIAEAFEDDDIVENFRKDKVDEIENDKTKDINLFLPGWGSWGGPGIKSTPKKRANKRFIIKFPEVSKRKDENKGNLVINEKSDHNVKPHLVSDVPFPFKTVKDFEASIRAPVGNTFIPETAYRKMIRPSVKTKIGSVIQPMSEEILLKVKN